MTNENTNETTIEGFCDVCGNQETDNIETLKTKRLCTESA